jgi:hypothetical protein
VNYFENFVENSIDPKEVSGFRFSAELPRELPRPFNNSANLAVNYTGR